MPAESNAFLKQGQANGKWVVSRGGVALQSVMLPRHTFILLAFATQIAWSVVQAANAPVVLVQGTTSMPTEAERLYGVSVTKRLSRWLDGIPIQHTTLTDEALTRTSLQDVKVLILGYNPNPQPEMLSVLKRYSDRGGKLIIFYGADPDLAALMGMRLGSYMAAKEAQCWSAMRVRAGGGDGLPAFVRQFSRSIRPVYPAARGARIVAGWDNAQGKPSGQPAIVESSRGYWITHVLLDDGDMRSKRRLLLACIGKHLPDAWRTAAEHALRSCGRVGDADSSQEVWRNTCQMVKEPDSPAVARDAYRQATASYQQAREAVTAGRYRETVDLCDAAEQALVQSIAASQPSRRSELRGVWDHAGLGLYPGDWSRTCRQLRDAGITDLYVNLLWPGKAHYPSEIVPHSRTYQDYGDQADACVKAGRRHGLRIHAWKVCWKLEGAPESFIAALGRQNRLQVTDRGESVPWLCPSRGDNVQVEVDAVRELVKRYPVDGIHLDYVRYKDSSVCCCDGCRTRFAHDSGLSVDPWPASLKRPDVRVAYSRWRCGRITHLVREMREMLRRDAPAVRLSAAVFGRYPLCMDSVGQDWYLWLKRGYVDAVCPMNYTDDPADFRRWVALQVALPGVSDRILPGIGVTARDCNLDPVQVIGQIREVRRQNLPGYLLFDLNQILAQETLPALALGISAK